MDNNLPSSASDRAHTVLGQLCLHHASDADSLHTVIALCADLYWQQGADGQCTGIRSYNPHTSGLAQLLMRTPLPALGQAASPEKATDWQQYLALTQQHKPFRQLHCLIREHQHHTRHHTEYYLAVSGTPHFDASGTFLGYECLAVDITQNHQREINLQRFRAAMDMSPDMIYLVDPKTLTLLDVNNTACQASGLSREEILAVGPSRLLGHSDEELRVRYQHLIETGVASRIEREFKRPSNGETVFVEVYSRATQIDDHWLVIGVSRDITLRKKAEQKALRLQQLFSALSLINEAILRADSVESLYRQACRAAVSSQLFTLVRVLAADEHGEFIALANAGDVLLPTKTMPIGYEPQRGDGASTLPLLQHKKPVAVMQFYASESDFFDDQVQSILQSMADNMSFALDNFANEAEQAIAAERIRQNEERFRSLTTLSSDFYWEMDASLRFTAYEGRTVGDSNTEAVRNVIGTALWENPGVEPDSMNWRQFRRMLAKEQAFRDFEFSFVNRQGLLYHLSLSGVPIINNHGQFIGYRGITRDITSKKRVANRIKHLATHDTLTGLPNRVMFSELLGQAIRNANRYKDQRFAVLFIDLDRFRAVNDTYGHHTGDLLLAEVARRLRNPLRQSDIVARLGGDEFVVLLQRISDKEQAARIAANVLNLFSQPITLELREFLIGASIGISLYGEDAYNEESLMTHADTAMYAAKEEGRNNFRLYSAELHQHRELRAGLAVELRHALKRGELFLNYQAKVEVATGRVTGVEALLRWRHREFGDISPAQFIPIAEDNGLIIPIGEWVMATACQQVLEWQRHGLPPLSLAVNLSARQFNHPELPVFIRQLLTDVGFPAAQLELEITESLVMQNPEHAISLMQDLKRTGIRFALDDFGTGYSSLGQLRHYPIDTLKIDRVFVRDIEHSREDQAISKAIISMGKTLGLTVVAEGVENSRQLAFLRHCQCDQIQGFIYHRPVDAREFSRWYLQQSQPQNALR